MHSSKLLLYSLSLVSLAVLPSIQHSVKGPQYPLQEPEPVKFVQSILTNNEPKDYCKVSCLYKIRLSGSNSFCCCCFSLPVKLRMLVAITKVLKPFKTTYMIKFKI